MGAGLVLRYATENDDFDGIIACSPAINFGKIGPISFLTKYAAYFMSYFIPQYTLASKIGAFYISRDKAVVEACEKDPLCTSSISLLTASDLIRNSNFLLNEDSAKLLSKPLLITHGSGDMITCHDSSEMFYNECIVEDKAFVSYNGWFHELHNEPDYMTVIQGYIDWIKNRV